MSLLFAQRPQLQTPSRTVSQYPSLTRTGKTLSEIPATLRDDDKSEDPDVPVVPYGAENSYEKLDEITALPKYKSLKVDGTDNKTQEETPHAAQYDDYRKSSKSTAAYLIPNDELFAPGYRDSTTRDSASQKAEKSGETRIAPKLPRPVESQYENQDGALTAPRYLTMIADDADNNSQYARDAE